VASVACRPRRESDVSSRGRGYRSFEVEGFEVLVGKGDAENDRLTFAIAGPRDFWLHVAGPAGSHVVVRNPEGRDELPGSVLERAAELAAWHSKARGAKGKVEVHVCRVGDVRKPRGFAPGQVLLRRWEAVRVYPRLAEDADAVDSSRGAQATDQGRRAKR
jgi:predicted ribosome quality control (RQC) complex YloA/Tae2 family protein